MIPASPNHERALLATLVGCHVFAEQNASVSPQRFGQQPRARSASPGPLLPEEAKEPLRKLYAEICPNKELEPDYKPPHGKPLQSRTRSSSAELQAPPDKLIAPQLHVGLVGAGGSGRHSIPPPPFRFCPPLSFHSENPLHLHPGGGHEASRRKSRVGVGDPGFSFSIRSPVN